MQNGQCVSVIRCDTYRCRKCEIDAFVFKTAELRLYVVGRWLTLPRRNFELVLGARTHYGSVSDVRDPVRRLSSPSRR